MLRPAFFDSKNSFLYNMCAQVIFFSEALRDPEVWFVIIVIGARLFFTLGVRSESFRLSVVMLVGSDVYIKDV